MNKSFMIVSFYGNIFIIPHHMGYINSISFFKNPPGIHQHIYLFYKITRVRSGTKISIKLSYVLAGFNSQVLLTRSQIFFKLPKRIRFCLFLRKEAFDEALNGKFIHMVFSSVQTTDRKSTRLNSSHGYISYA